MDEILSVGISGEKFKTFNYMNWAVNQTFTYANNSLFYAQINPIYFDYYNRIVKVNLEWFDGYVHGFHNNMNGIMSTRIATALVNGIISNVFSTKLVFDNMDDNKNYESVDFFSHWVKEHNFLNELKTLSKFSGASGTSLLKLNVDANKEIWCQALRQDQFLFEMDSRGNVESATIFLKPYEDINPNHESYYIIETRYFGKISKKNPVKMIEGETREFEDIIKKHVPFVEYKVLYYRGQIMQNAMQPTKMQSLSWHDLPKNIKVMIKKDFNTMKFDVPIELPFKDSLGCFALMINGKDPTIATGNLGYSLLTDVRSCLIEYELIQAYAMRDMYNAQGQVGIPKAMSMNDFDNSPYSANKSNYEVFPGDPDKQKPIITQFELRAEEWIKKANACLQRMATILGMSPKVIASYLNTAWSNSFGKTATEVESDDSNNQIFLEDKRENLLACINRVIPHILRFYGMKEEISARFLKTNSNPTSQDLRDIDFKYQNGYIDLRGALREMNPTVTEQELDTLEQRATERKTEMEKKEQIEINAFGDYEK